MVQGDRPLVWLRAEIKSPPLSPAARIEAGVLLRRLQRGEHLGLPHARPMASIAARCVELRIPDGDHTWRVICRIDSDAVVILDVFSKKTQKTPQHVIDLCRRRLKEYDQAVGGTNG